MQESAKSVQDTSSSDIENDTGQERFSRSKNTHSSIRERKIFERIRQDQIRRYMSENNEVLPEEWCSFSEDYFYVYKNYSFTEYRITRRIEITQDKNPLIQEIEREFYYGDKVEQSREISDKMAEGFRRSKNSSDWHNVNAAEAGGTGRVYGVDDFSSRSNSSGTDKKGSGNLDGGRTSGLTEKFSSENSLYLQEENERLRKEYQATKQKLRDMKRQRDYWKDEVTTAPILNRDDVKSVTENLLSSYSSKADKTTIFNALKSLGEFIIRGGDRTTDLEWTTVKEKAVDIASLLTR